MAGDTNAVELLSTCERVLRALPGFLPACAASQAGRPWLACCASLASYAGMEGRGEGPGDCLCDRGARALIAGTYAAGLDALARDCAVDVPPDKRHCLVRAAPRQEEEEAGAAAGNATAATASTAPAPEAPPGPVAVGAAGLGPQWIVLIAAAGCLLAVGAALLAAFALRRRRRQRLACGREGGEAAGAEKDEDSSGKGGAGAEGGAAGGDVEDPDPRFGFAQDASPMPGAAERPRLRPCLSDPDVVDAEPFLVPRAGARPWPAAGLGVELQPVSAAPREAGSASPPPPPPEEEDEEEDEEPRLQRLPRPHPRLPLRPRPDLANVAGQDLSPSKAFALATLKKVQTTIRDLCDQTAASDAIYDHLHRHAQAVARHKERARLAPVSSLTEHEPRPPRPLPPIPEIAEAEASPGAEPGTPLGDWTAARLFSEMR